MDTTYGSIYIVNRSIDISFFQASARVLLEEAQRKRRFQEAKAKVHRNLGSKVTKDAELAKLHLNICGFGKATD